MYLWVVAVPDNINRLLLPHCSVNISWICPILYVALLQAGLLANTILDNLTFLISSPNKQNLSWCITNSCFVLNRQCCHTLQKRTYWTRECASTVLTLQSLSLWSLFSQSWWEGWLSSLVVSADVILFQIYKEEHHWHYFNELPTLKLESISNESKSLSRGMSSRGYSSTFTKETPSSCLWKQVTTFYLNI